MGSAAADPALHHPARALLERQTVLIDEQIVLARHERRRSFAKFVRDAVLAFLALAAVALGTAIVWDATQAEGMVVRPLSVPAGAEVDGEAAAARLVDRLARLQAATVSARPARRAGLDEEIALQIPSTGMSVGEGLRLLRDWLGRETVVTGDLSRTADGGWIVSLRVDGRPVNPLPPPLPDGARSDARATPAPVTPDQALDHGAQAVLSAADPYRYSVWLRGAGRAAEASAVLRALSLSGPAEERAWAYSGLAVDAREEGRLDDSRRLLAEALRLQPDLLPAWSNLSTLEALLDRREHAIRAERELLRRGADATAPELRYLVRQTRMYLLAETGDVDGALRTLEAALEEPLARGVGPLHRTRALLLVQRHEPSAAMAAYALGPTPFAALSPTHRFNFETAAFDTWDDPARVEAAFPPPPTGADVSALDGVIDQRVRRPWQALVRGRQGRADEARALIATTPLDCLFCVQVRARVAAYAGDVREAERWFAETARQAPSTPDVWLQWARFRLARGDSDGALALLRRARETGPRWADPLKVEGDALAARRDWSGAIARYQAAARQAPRWGALHLARGRALAASGRRGEALATWRAAAGMNLSAADRAALQRLLAGAPA